MSRDVLENKVISLKRCVARVRESIPATRENLDEDFDRQDVLVLNIVRAVQLCVDIASHALSESGHESPANMGEAFTRLHRLGWIDASLAEHMRKAVAFRNIAVHAYQRLDLDVLFAVSVRYMEDFEEFARQALQAMDRSA